MAGPRGGVPTDAQAPSPSSPVSLQSESEPAPRRPAGAVLFLAPTLARWDQLTETPEGPPELLALPFFADERPLRGAAGLCDWRLCGRLSRLLVAGRIGGNFGETTLLPAQRLPFTKLLLFGLGPADRFDEPAYREAALGLRQVIGRLGVRRYALALPGRSTGHIMARRALELWLETADPAAEVWLIEPQAAQKEMSEALGRRR